MRAFYSLGGRTRTNLYFWRGRLSVRLRNYSYPSDRLEIRVYEDLQTATRDLTLNVDGTAFAFENATNPTSQIRRWDDAGLNWTVGDTVSLTLTDFSGRPSVPSAPSIGATDGSNGSLDVGWLEPANAGPFVKYYLRYREVTYGPWSNGPQDVTINFANITGLRSGANYEVQVLASNSNGESEWSPSGTGQTDSGIRPAAPTTLNATANGQNRIDLNWTSPEYHGNSSVRSYKIEVRSDASDWLTLVPSTSNTDTEYSHTGLPANTTRHYRVSAINTQGTGAPSEHHPDTLDASATTERLQQLDQVVDVTITPRDGALKVRWTEVTEAQGYKVQWKSGGANYNSGSRQATITSGLTTEHTIGDLTNATEYTVRVIATRYPINDGPPSETATGTPRAGANGGGGGRTPTPEPQTQQAQTPLTASFVSVPAEHDGETAFWLELSFDAPVVQGSKARIRELLAVTGGSETRLRRKDGRLDHWQIRVDPVSQNTVTVTLSPSPACGETGAVCTEDGRTFTTGLATQIQGPASGNSNWSEESVGTAVTPVPALPLVGVGLLGLLLALFGSRAVVDDRRHLDASRGR